jgi:hypothetical protein
VKLGDNVQFQLRVGSGYQTTDVRNHYYNSLGHELFYVAWDNLWSILNFYLYDELVDTLWLKLKGQQ